MNTVIIAIGMLIGAIDTPTSDERIRVLNSQINNLEDKKEWLIEDIFQNRLTFLEAKEGMNQLDVQIDSLFVIYNNIK